MLTLLVLSRTMLAIGTYTSGDTLYIWAFNGLILRNGPSLKNAGVTTIPYGAFAVVLPQNSKKKESLREFGGFILHGSWVKIQYADSLEGFVFDGYLSKYPALKHKRSNEWWKEVFLPYAANTFGKPKHNFYKNKKGDGCGACYGYKNTNKYPNGVVAVEELLEGDGGHYVFTLEIPGFSFEEAYLFLVLNPILWNKKYLKYYNVDEQYLQIEIQDDKQVKIHRELTTYIFEKKAGRIFIQFWSSC